MMVGKQWRARILHAIISVFWATPVLQGYWDSSQPWPNTPTEDLACWQMWKSGLQRFHVPDPWDFGYLDTLLLLFLHQSQRLCLGVICTLLLNIIPFAPQKALFLLEGSSCFQVLGWEHLEGFVGCWSCLLPFHSCTCASQNSVSQSYSSLPSTSKKLCKLKEKNNIYEKNVHGLDEHGKHSLSNFCLSL